MHSGGMTMHMRTPNTLSRRFAPGLVVLSLVLSGQSGAEEAGQGHDFAHVRIEPLAILRRDLPAHVQVDLVDDHSVRNPTIIAALSAKPISTE